MAIHTKLSYSHSEAKRFLFAVMSRYLTEDISNIILHTFRRKSSEQKNHREATKRKKEMTMKKQNLESR